MIRLSEISGAPAGTPAVRWDQRSVDVLSVVQTARTLRADFIADHLRRGTQSFSRRSGLADLFATLKRRHERRRTLKALELLDDRMLGDIGISRADIQATAADCCGKQEVASRSVWHGLAAWARQEARRRRTVRELSAMSDEILADVGISRADIPAVAAALFMEQPQQTATGETATTETTTGDNGTGVPVTAQVLAFVAMRRSQQQAANKAANQNADRPAA